MKGPEGSATLKNEASRSSYRLARPSIHSAALSQAVSGPQDCANAAAECCELLVGFAPQATALKMLRCRRCAV